ncbi:ABC transporter permease [Geminicoccus roseus]|uniref:ABC transporter permease n=1 Tax=Geminicoccus roseus TaxID=404900 RepID=UPI000488DF8F|nr:ABC transporter permease [Geminicoccus roseus]
MAAAAIGAPHGANWLRTGRTLPVLVVTLAILAIWYAGAVWLNAPQVVDRYGDEPWTWTQLVEDSWAMDRPVLPAPHQVLAELNKTVLQTAATSKRSLVYHAWITLSATLLGFVLGTLLGILLAVGIVHVRTLDTSLMPWVIASQTIPILAIAPMVVVVLGSIGLTGLVPKALISMYLCFFPVTIGMVKGLRSPDVLSLELMHTWSARPSQVLWKLRWPASVPFLFASLKVAIAISLVGAIVGEMPTGAQAGIGARLLSGSYYGQTVQIWAALVMGSVMAGLLIAAIAWMERITLRAMGTKP